MSFTVGQLMIEMAADVARLRTDMDAARRVVESTTTRIAKAADFARNAIGGIGAGLAATAVGGKLIAVQREFDVLNSSLVAVTGSSMAAQAEFEWIKRFAATTPYQLNEVVGAFTKMKALGLDASQAALQSYGNTASAMGKSLNQLVEAVADAATGEFERLKEFGIKAKQQGDSVSLTFQGVTTRIGNNAAEITRYLQNIGNVNFATAMETRAATLDGAISNLADNWDQLWLTISSKDAGSFIADSVRAASESLSTLTLLINAASGAAGNNARQTGAMAVAQEALAVVLETVVSLGLNVGYVLKGVGRELGGLAAQAVALAQLDLEAAKAIRAEMVADADAARREVDAATSRVLNARRLAQLAEDANRGQDYRAEDARLARLANATTATNALAGATRALGSAQQDAARKTKQQQDAFASLAQSLNKDLVKAMGDVARQTGNLTAAEQKLLELQASGQWAQMTQAQRAYVEVLVQRTAEQERSNAVLLRSAEVEQDMARQQASSLEATRQQAASINERARALVEEAARIGLTAEQLGALEQARLDEAITLQEAMLIVEQSINGRTAEATAIEDVIAALNELKQAQALNTAKKAAEDTAKEYGKAGEEIQRDLTGALFRAFESGKDFASAFTDTLRNTLKTALLKPVIEGMVKDLIGSLNGAMGRLGGQGGLGGGSGGLLNSLGQMLGLGGGGAGGGGAGAAGGAGGSLGALASLGPLGQTLGAFYASYEISKAISNGYQMNGILGKLGNFGGIVGGTLNRAFGRRAPEVREQGISGTIGGGSFSGQAFADIVEKGGWFRSDKRYTNTSALDAGTAGALSTAATTTLAQAQVWAEALELPAAKLADITMAMRVKLGSDQAENARAIDAAVADYQDKLAASFGSVLQPFQKAGERLSQTLQRMAVLQTFSENLNSLGGVFSRVAGLGWQARESFISMAGGLEALNQMVMGYTQNYYSREEIAGLKATEIQTALQAAGLDTSGLSSRADYRTLVESLDVSTVEGREQLALLLKLQGDFAQVGDYLSETGQSLAAAAAQAPATSVLANLLSGSQAEQQSQAQVDATLTVAAKVDGLTGLMQQTVNLLSQMSSSGTGLTGTARTSWEVNA